MKLLSYLKRVLLKNGTLTKIILLGTFWAITLGVYNLLRNDLTNESIKFLFLDAKICEFVISVNRKATFSGVFTNYENLIPTYQKQRTSCFRKCEWQEKSSSGHLQIYFFNRFSGYIFFSFLISFAFFDSCFFCLFCFWFFEIEKVYSNTHSTMRAGEW